VPVNRRAPFAKLPSRGFPALRFRGLAGVRCGAERPKSLGPSTKALLTLRFRLRRELHTPFGSEQAARASYRAGTFSVRHAAEAPTSEVPCRTATTRVSSSRTSAPRTASTNSASTPPASHGPELLPPTSARLSPDPPPNPRLGRRGLGFQRSFTRPLLSLGQARHHPLPPALHLRARGAIRCSSTSAVKTIASTTTSVRTLPT
jgi:hypothetical protein